MPRVFSTHVTTKAILTDPLAIHALEKALRSVNVFKYAVVLPG